MPPLLAKKLVARSCRTFRCRLWGPEGAVGALPPFTISPLNGRIWRERTLEDNDGSRAGVPDLGRQRTGRFREAEGSKRTITLPTLAIEFGIVDVARLRCGVSRMEAHTLHALRSSVPRSDKAPLAIRRSRRCRAAGAAPAEAWRHRGQVCRARSRHMASSPRGR